jgi:hypothetical protein
MPKSVRATVTATGARRLYLNRAMQTGTVVDIDSASVDAAVLLGYIQAPVGWRQRAMFPAGKKTQEAEPQQEQAASEQPAKKRGRPRKGEGPTRQAKREAAALDEKTVPELREMAEERGVDLPPGYVKKDDLVEKIEQVYGEQDQD